MILFNWSGHGLVDMAAYDACLTGKLSNHSLEEDKIKKALADIDPFPKPQQFTK